MWEVSHTKFKAYFNACIIIENPHAVKDLADFNFKAFYTQLKERGFVIYPGKISQADTFRIGNIGDVHPEDFRQLIEIIRECKY